MSLRLVAGHEKRQPPLEHVGRTQDRTVGGDDRTDDDDGAGLRGRRHHVGDLRTDVRDAPDD